MFEGCHVATITPFREDQSVDYDRLAQFVESYVSSGIAGVVPCGTTGESPTLSHEEHQEVIRTTIQAASGRIQVIAGTGSNSTEEAVQLTRSAATAGADAALVITPYYNKPTQEGLYRHFSKIHDESEIPLVLYNVPGRTGTHLAMDTFLRLAEKPRILAVKEASADLDLASEIAMQTDLEVLSGDDSLTLPVLSVGGVGVISVVANLFPAAMQELIEAFSSGRSQDALDLHRTLFPICRAMFLESNPIPVKAAMRILGRDTGTVRLPLSPLSPDFETELARVIAPSQTESLPRRTSAVST